MLYKASFMQFKQIHVSTITPADTCVNDVLNAVTTAVRVT